MNTLSDAKQECLVNSYYKQINKAIRKVHPNFIDDRLVRFFRYNLKKILRMIVSKFSYKFRLILKDIICAMLIYISAYIPRWGYSKFLVLIEVFINDLYYRFNKKDSRKPLMICCFDETECNLISNVIDLIIYQLNEKIPQFVSSSHHWLSIDDRWDRCVKFGGLSIEGSRGDLANDLFVDKTTRLYHIHFNRDLQSMLVSFLKN